LFTSGKVPTQFLLRSNTRVSGYLLRILVYSLEFVLSLPFAASGSLSGKIKKLQGARVESRTSVGGIKLSEEMGACVGEVREQGSCDPARRDRTKA
jgi:hypothetical protein